MFSYSKIETEMNHTRIEKNNIYGKVNTFFDDTTCRRRRKSLQQCADDAIKYKTNNATPACCIEPQEADEVMVRGNNNEVFDISVIMDGETDGKAAVTSRMASCRSESSGVNSGKPDYTPEKANRVNGNQDYKSEKEEYKSEIIGIIQVNTNHSPDLCNHSPVSCNYSLDKCNHKSSKRYRTNRMSVSTNEMSGITSEKANRTSGKQYYNPGKRYSTNRMSDATNEMSGVTSKKTNRTSKMQYYKNEKTNRASEKVNRTSEKAFYIITMTIQNKRMSFNDTKNLLNL